MTAEQLDIFAMFQYIKVVSQQFIHVALNNNEIFVGDTKIKLSYKKSIQIKLTEQLDPVWVKCVYLNLDYAYAKLVSDTKQILNKILSDTYKQLTSSTEETSQSNIANLIAEFAFEDPKVMGIKDINVKIQNWKILEQIDLVSQGAYTYIKLLASANSIMENVLKAMSVVQFKASVNIYKNSQQGYDQSDLYLLGMSTISEAFYEVYKGNYIGGVTPFVMPIAIMSTTALISKKYSNIVDECVKYTGYIFTVFSFGVLAKEVYDSFQDISVYSFIMAGTLTAASIKLSIPVVIMASIIAVPSSAIYKYYNDQQTTATLDEESSGIYLFPMIFKTFKCENCFTICT